MYGYYDIPCSIESERISLSFQEEDGHVVYRRSCADDRIEKLLLTTGGRVLVNPVEPLNTPKEIAAHLLIEFDRSVVVAPRESQKIFVTFPIEIGVFTSAGREFEMLDVFSLAPKKFTLYGSPRTGTICKHWRSPVAAAMPVVDYLREGIMELEISNAAGRWVEVGKAVFNAQGMKIYYSKEMVAMRAVMKLTSREMAETEFVKAPMKKKMKKSLELYSTRKLQIVSPKFVMEHGL